MTCGLHLTTENLIHTIACPQFLFAQLHYNNESQLSIILTGYVFIVAVSVSVALFTVILAVILMSTVWIHLVQLPHSSQLPIRQASTIILGDFNSFYYEQVNVGINEDHLPNNTGDTDFSIDIYGIQTSCANIDLHDHNFDVILTEKNISKSTPVYALVDSFFTFELSGTISNSSSVQNEFVDVCINTGPSYNDGKTLECVKESLFESSGKYRVTKRGYYFITVHPLGGTVQYSMNIYGNVKKIRVSTSEMLCGLNRSNSMCRISLPGKSNRHCLLAEFYRLHDKSTTTELYVRVENSRVSFVLGITLPPIIIAVFILVFFSLCCRIICVKYFRKCRKKQPLHSLTYSI